MMTELRRRSSIMQHGTLIAKATVIGGGDAPRYFQKVQCGKHAMVADESAEGGGQNAGPSPFDYLISGLGACTSITLRMYGERKGWELGTVTVEVRLKRENDENRIDRTVSISGSLSETQRAKLTEICERTPVTLAVKPGIPIETRLFDGST
jgi:putative redox protein